MVFLTDRAFATGITLDDVFHTVQPGDASGTSYKVTFNQLKTLLSGPFGIANSTGVYTYYNTLQLAINAASSGQTVEVFTDYTETGFVTINLKDGVDINFNGHTYTLDSSGANNAFTASGPVNCRLLNGIIVRRGSTLNASSSNICLALFSSSSIITDCQFKGSHAIVYSTSSGSTINGGRFFSEGNFSNSFFGIVTTAGVINDAIIELSSIPPQGSSGLYLSGGSANNCGVYIEGFDNLGIRSINGNINNCIIDAISTSVRMTGGTLSNTYCNGNIGCYGNTNVPTVISNSTITTSLQGVFISNSAQDVELLGCSIYALSNQGISVGGINTLISNCFVYSNNQSIVVLGSNTSINNSSFYSLTSQGINISAGPRDVTIKNCVSTSLTSSSITNNSSTATTITNTVAESLWQNAAGHSIVIGSSYSGHTIAFCHLITSNTTANAIRGSSNGGVRYVNNVFDGMTTPVFNITQLTTNVGDTRGNIQT